MCAIEVAVVLLAHLIFVLKIMSVYLVNFKVFRIFLRSILAPALQIQATLGIAFLITFLVSGYYSVNPHGYPTEQPWIPLLFSFVAFSTGAIGWWLQKIDPPKTSISLRRGSWIVLFVWAIAVTITALYFTISGVPEPNSTLSFAIKFLNSAYEALSGYTTTGASILPSVEVFPRSLLFFRTLTHWLGGMGIAYIGVTLWKNFTSSREAIINSESESPDVVTYQNNSEARESGLDFLKAYTVLSVILFLLLLTSGAIFRQIPYTNWSDNVFDSITHTFSVMGTGGFSNYNKSAGLPLSEGGQIIPGGLSNTVSEWIIAFFMLFAGMNFSLWYILIFTKKNWTKIRKNLELKAYLAFTFLSTAFIATILAKNHFYPTLEQTLRYSFFNVTTIISTTGLGNWDFVRWPSAAWGTIYLLSCWWHGRFNRWWA